MLLKPPSNAFCDVEMDSWVGKIERVNEELVLQFSDGALCRVLDSDLLDDFEPVKDHVSSPVLELNTYYFFCIYSLLVFV